MNPEMQKEAIQGIMDALSAIEQNVLALAIDLGLAEDTGEQLPTEL